MVWQEELPLRESRQAVGGIRGVDGREPREGHRILQRDQSLAQGLLSILEERWVRALAQLTAFAFSATTGQD